MPKFMRRIGTSFEVDYIEEAYKDNPSWWEIVEPKQIGKLEEVAVLEVEKKQIEDGIAGLSMTEHDKLQSILNAVKIIPHSTYIKYKGNMQPKLSDVEAVVGFKVTIEQLQQALETKKDK
jgi:hypothetical protein